MDGTNKQTKLLLTDLMLHTKDMRPTPSLEKANAHTSHGFPSPRFYSGMNQLETASDDPNGTFAFEIKLPPDVQEKVDRGEITLESLRLTGVPVYPGRDLIEYDMKMNRAQRRQLIHRGRTWRAGQK